MTEQAHHEPVSDEEVAALARVAGLAISTERLTRLGVEIGAAMAADRELDAAAGRGTGLGGEPFDPAWPSSDAGYCR